MAKLLPIQTGRASDAEWVGRPKRTAIDKRTVDGPVALGKLGIDGDQQADVENHGGTGRAVYAYASEDLARWPQLLDLHLRTGQFGENLTTAGIDSSRIVIGEKWAIGSAIFEVSAPRIPCSVFANWLNEKTLVKRFSDDGRPGPYLRVRQEGIIQAGDPITVFDIP